MIHAPCAVYEETVRLDTEFPGASRNSVEERLLGCRGSLAWPAFCFLWDLADGASLRAFMQNVVINFGYTHFFVICFPVSNCWRH